MRDRSSTIQYSSVIARLICGLYDPDRERSPTVSPDRTPERKSRLLYRSHQGPMERHAEQVAPWPLGLDTTHKNTAGRPSETETIGAQASFSSLGGKMISTGTYNSSGTGDKVMLAPVVADRQGSIKKFYP